VRLPDYRVLRWLQIAGILLAASVVFFFSFGGTSGVIFLAGAVICAVRAVIEHRHIRREN
jgi:hypothetical protein